MRQILKDRVGHKRTRIVATIGPKSESKEVLSEMVRAGMNVARLNFSHGDFAEHGAKVKNVREVAEEQGVPVAVLQDLAGPEIRLGTFSEDRENDIATIVEGQEFTLTTRDIDECNDKITTVDYTELPKQVKPGEILILDDGKRILKVKESTDTDIITEVVVGGPIAGRRCLFAPDSKLTMSSLTQKDKKDLAFAFEYDVDYIAISFVRGASDVRELREILKENNAEHIKIVSKIETKEAMENLDEIIAETDAVMVARGDLGVELPATEVPLAQKTIISKANQAGKPVITATQMLLSMVEKPSATRAEISDAANAILDGTDALMLSEESALGKYPVEAVKTLASVATAVDKTAYSYRSRYARHADAYLDDGVQETSDVVTSSVYQMARRIDAKAIVALTESGDTARHISRFKPAAPIVALTPNDVTYRQLALSSNCFAVKIEPFEYVVDVMDAVDKLLKGEGLASEGDRVAVAAGVPFGRSGSINLSMVHTIK